VRPNLARDLVQEHERFRPEVLHTCEARMSPASRPWDDGGTHERTLYRCLRLSDDATTLETMRVG
jgi:hypothetical protein